MMDIVASETKIDVVAINVIVAIIAPVVATRFIPVVIINVEENRLSNMLTSVYSEVSIVSILVLTVPKFYLSKVKDILISLLEILLSI
jgi:hypothetical protein